ncbi:PqqD family protein [Desulforhopalus sp. 52FAK]
MKLLRLFRRKTTVPPEEPKVTRTESLACVPARVPSISWDEDEAHKVIIEYPLAIKPFFISIAKKFNKGEEQRLTKKLQLDNIGSRVWLMLDGETDVKTIIKKIAPPAGLTLQEAEVSVTTFLRELGRRGLIVIKFPVP